MQAIIDEHERSRLLAVAPDFDLVPAGLLGLDDFPADRGRGFFAPAAPGPEWTVDVVESRDARRHFPILAEMPAHALGE